ncbi:MAG: 2Fe-2S iron-sulfur cluster-binding protein [Chitinophagales bacterium]|nr:2Fe-2S iron-sulfur cluster-binding protein [Chitinophagales bacterium]
MSKPSIHFTVLVYGSTYSLQTYEGEYRNLMVLLKDKLFVDYFGECGGLGRCGTCVIKIKGLSGAALIKDRNEPVTLSKMGYNETEHIRLSCQLMITESLNNTEIEILEQEYL